MGRPSIYTQAVADDVISRIEKGQSVRFIGDEEGLPCSNTIHEWVKNIPEFAERYARAKESYADSVFEELLEISDDSRNDWIERETQKGSFITLNDEAISRARLRVDTRKWMLSKLSPKKYGEKLEIDASVAGKIVIEIGGNAE